MAIWKDGIPYSMDVRRLEEMFPVKELREGLEIAHETMEGIIGVPAKSRRYYGVVNAWRRKVYNAHRIRILSRVGIGYYVPEPVELLEHGERVMLSGGRKIVRGVRILANDVDRARLDLPGQQILDHKMRAAGMLEDAWRRAKKALPIELGPAHSLPKRPIAAQLQFGETEKE